MKQKGMWGILEVRNWNLVSTFCYLSLEWKLGDFLYSGGIHRFFGWSFNSINNYHHCHQYEENKASPVAEDACVKRARLFYCNMLLCCRAIKQDIRSQNGQNHHTVICWHVNQYIKQHSSSTCAKATNINAVKSSKCASLV